MYFGFLDCCGRREGEAMVMQRKANVMAPPGAPPQDESPKCGVGIVFASDGSGGLIVKGFVPKSTAAKSGQILENDLLVRVDGTDVHRWPVSEIAPLMLGPAGSTVTLGFLRRIQSANDIAQSEEQLSEGQNGSQKTKVPKLWKQGETPRNEGGSTQEGKGDQFRLFQVTLTRGQTSTFSGQKPDPKARPPPERFIPS
mmetsp:Transcript_55220/g.145739  ORF Transcript_55220/g.145739 Transcript_55220/m.145739 type:complete len:198 (-) Transcript_55220:100-693(-)